MFYINKVVYKLICLWIREFRSRIGYHSCPIRHLALTVMMMIGYHLPRISLISGVKVEFQVWNRVGISGVYM